MSWRGIEVVRSESGPNLVRLAEFEDDALGPGDVTVDVAWSSLNYKDALALTGRPGIVRTSPLRAGIDLVGVVSDSGHPDWRPGDPVLVNGCGMSETRHGGLAERARVDADWLVRVPDTFDLRQAAAIGTAGFTAQLAVLELERAGATGDIVVTGATGGVGSYAIALLAAAGLRVVAATGRPEGGERLRALGAADVIDRRELEDAEGALQSQRWGGAVDNVGGRILANVLAQTRYGGLVASVGNAASSELTGSVMPFILRAVTLAGINSVSAPRELRLRAWDRLARDLDPSVVDELAREVPLEGAIAEAAGLVAGRGTGRIVIDVGG